MWLLPAPAESTPCSGYTNLRLQLGLTDAGLGGKGRLQSGVKLCQPTEGVKMANALSASWKHIYYVSDGLCGKRLLMVHKTGEAVNLVLKLFITPWGGEGKPYM